MKKREKILLAVMLVVAIGAGIYLFLDSSPQKKKAAPRAAKSTAQTRTVDLSQYPDIKEEKLAIELSPNQKKVLAMSALPWDKDVFFKKQKKRTKAQKKVEAKLFSYTGIIDLGSDRFAIINNKNYREGERLKDWAGYTVGKITTKNVTIYTPQKKPLVISYTDTRPFVWEPPKKEKTEPRKEEPGQPETPKEEKNSQNNQ